MKRIIVILWAALFPLTVQAAQAKAGPKQSLEARLSLNVDWNKINKESGDAHRGFMHLTLSGTLRINESFSGPSRGKAPLLISYSFENATFSYRYKDEYFMNNPDNPPKCPNPQSIYEGQGSISGGSGGAAINLGLHYHAGLAGNVDKIPFNFPAEMADVLIDYYEFILPVPEQKISGKSKEYIGEGAGCRERDQSRKIFGGIIEILAPIGQGGRMSGSKNWSSDSGASSFSVAVSDLSSTFRHKPVSPPPGKDNDVHYSLSWDLDALPVVEVLWKSGGVWLDVTNKEQEVVTGEKIELRGQVLPRSADPGSGTWTVDGGQGRPIKKYEASLEQAEVIRLDSNDLQQQNLTLYWTDQGQEKVTYRTKADGQDVSAEVTFKIKKPAFDLQAEAAQSNTYGPLEFGLANPSAECCVEALSPEERQRIQNCLEAQKGMATNPTDRRYYERYCLVRGLQYNGITFTACPLDDTPGKVQFVQLVSRVDTRQPASGGGGQSQSTPQGLDGCYPYPQISEYQAMDRPGFSDPADSASLAKDFIFTMVLMFKPDGEENEWVPLKVADWSWKGAIKCSAGACREDASARDFPHSTAGQDTNEYPKWNHCSQTGR